MTCLTTRSAKWALCLALSALLVSGPAWSQGGGKGPGAKVEVGPSGAPGAPAAAPTTAPAAKPARTSDVVKRPTPRNPFLQPGANAPIVVRPVGPQSGTKPPVQKVPQPRVEPAPPPPEPTFQLAGIVQSGGYLKAMLIVGTDVATVKVGDRVQGYQVTSIDMTARQVTVTMKNTAFRVKLPRETPYGTAKPSENPSKGSGGPPQGAPLPPPPAPAPAGPGK